MGCGSILHDNFFGRLSHQGVRFNCGSILHDNFFGRFGCYELCLFHLGSFGGSGLRYLFYNCLCNFLGRRFGNCGGLGYLFAGFSESLIVVGGHVRVGLLDYNFCLRARQRFLARRGYGIARYSQ